MADSSSPATASAVDPVRPSCEDRRLLSSPPRGASEAAAGAGGKERRQPSITPRKFRRFFTPRSRVSSHPSAARRALRDLTARALNNRSPTTQTAAAATTPSGRPLLFSSSPLAAAAAAEGAAHHDKSDAGLLHSPLSPRSAKRRKTGHYAALESSPLRPAPAVPRDVVTPENQHIVRTSPASMLLSPLASSPLPGMSAMAADDDELLLSDDADDLTLSDDGEPALPFPEPRSARRVTLAEHGLAGQLLQRQLGCGPGLCRAPVRPVGDWRIETADFCSSSNDSHFSSSQDSESAPCIPFCASACNSDEEGRIQLLDSAAHSADGFSKVYLSFAAHGNAIIDLAFSEDDATLATASGDQSGKVFDMMTQTPISILDHHTASLKQVRFQPGRGQGHVLATSGRDGSVKIWDLRCRGGPAQDFTVERASGLHYTLSRKVHPGCVVNSIYDAHARTVRPTRQMRQRMQEAVAADVTTRWEAPGRVGEVSVTAIQFLPPGQEHLLLSACEADASIKLWDIRNVHTSRQKTSQPLSVTAPPESHSQWRPFGMSALSLSTDGARLYGLCKDNTVYAYATSHLVLGSAPELAAARGGHEPPRRRNGVVHEGLGPLYGFRHEQLHATSFYVKTAVRPARDGRPELLAVGSSDGCALLFPTDERYFLGGAFHAQAADAAPRYDHTSLPIFTSSPAAITRTLGDDGHGDDDEHGTMVARSTAAARAPTGGRRPGGGLFRRTNSTTSVQGRLVDTVPIVRSGTALVRGHDKKEVGAVCWTNEGSLVTVGDDCVVRCWREDRQRAADLRTGGEGGGRRWAAGWADVGGAHWEGDADEWMEEEEEEE